MTWQDILKMTNKWDRFSVKALEIAEKEGKDKLLVSFLRYLPTTFSKTMDSKQYNKIWQEVVVESFGPSQTLNYLSLFRVAFYRNAEAFLPENMEELNLYGPTNTIGYKTLHYADSKRNLDSRKSQVKKLINEKKLNNIFIVYRTKQKSSNAWETQTRNTYVYYLNNGFIFSVRLHGNYKSYFNKHIKGSHYVLNYLDTTKIGKNAKTKIIRGGYI